MLTKVNTYRIVFFSPHSSFFSDVKEGLVQKGMTISSAANYPSLLGLIEDKKNCIIISDYLFPAFNGLELLQKVKKDFNKVPPIIFVLEDYKIEIIESLIENGARDFIVDGKSNLISIFERIVLLMTHLEREKKQLEIARSENKPDEFTRFLNVIDELVFIRELEGPFITVNNNSLERLRYSREEMLTMEPEKIIAPQKVFDYLLEVRLLTDKKKHVYETELISKDFRSIPVEISSSITEIKGKEVIISIARDISDRLETNEELKNLNIDLAKINREYKTQNDRLRNINREIEENRHALKLALNEAENAEKLKNRFLANMSHEIRTPMNAIVGFSQLLEDADPEDVSDFIRIINNNSDTLLQLINDLMDIAKIESDLVAINTEPLNIHLLLLDIKTIFDFDKYNKEKGHIEIKYSQTNDLDLIIETDKLRLKQLLMNLVNNALKFTQEGSVEIDFIIKDQSVHIYVRDTGIGIPIKLQQQIFERFQQIDHIEKPQGTGIGLSISRSLMRLLGGEISLSSEVNQGSVFEIIHPLSQENNSKVKPPQKNMVMIAEDEEDNYHLLKYVLKDLNLDVIWAKNGKEAIDYCKEKNICLILMDIKMPTVDGLQATTEILKLQPDLPIIAQTAYTQDEDIERCKRAGCVEFIAKPINLTHLRRTIAKYV